MRAIIGKLGSKKGDKQNSDLPPSKKGTILHPRVVLKDIGIPVFYQFLCILFIEIPGRMLIQLAPPNLRILVRFAGIVLVGVVFLKSDIIQYIRGRRPSPHRTMLIKAIAFFIVVVLILAFS